MRKILLLLFPFSLAFAAVNNVRVTATNTQTVISYIAPGYTACSPEASESNTYSPLVHYMGAWPCRERTSISAPATKERT